MFFTVDLYLAVTYDDLFRIANKLCKKRNNRREEYPWNVLQNGAKSIAPVPIPLATNGADAVPVSSITETMEKFPAVFLHLQESGATTVRPKISSGTGKNSAA